jgi:hypothetical protein
MPTPQAVAPDPPSQVVPVRQRYFSDGKKPLPAAELQWAYEVAPDTFVVVRPEELRSFTQKYGAFASENLVSRYSGRKLCECLTISGGGSL